MLNLLSKTQSKELVQAKNNKGQNLFHIFAQAAVRCNHEVLMKIYKELNKRGVLFELQDMYKRNSLHYAAKSQAEHLIKLMLEEKRVDVNALDEDGESAFSYFIRGSGI